MSWFQDLAGKAENILNQIDKNAANVLHKSEDKLIVGPDGVSSEATNDVCLEIQEDDLTSIEAPKTIIRSTKLSPKNVLPIKRSMSTASMDKTRQTQEIVVNRNGSSEQAYPLSNSNSTSRRSSLSSRADLMSVVENENRGDYEPPLTTTLNLGTPQISSELEDALSRLTYMQARANAAELELENLRSESTKEKAEYLKNISDRDAKLLSLSQLQEETHQKLEWSKQEAEQAQNELTHYRSRAQSTLLMKDKIIEQLQTNSESNQNQFSHSVPDTSNTLALEELQTEKSYLLEETKSLSEQLTTLRGYVDRLELSQNLQQDEFNLRLEEVNRNSLRSEESRLREYESRNQMQLRELLMVREEMARLQTDHASQIQSK